MLTPVILVQTGIRLPDPRVHEDDKKGKNTSQREAFMDQAIICDFALTRDGSRCLKYAMWFAGAVKRELFVRMPDQENHLALARAMSGRFGVSLASPGIHLAGSDVRFAEQDAPCIFVSHLPLAEAKRHAPPRAHLLLSLQEDGERQCQGTHPVCLPFGSRDMEMRAADLAFPIAKRLGTRVIAAHTTYRKPGIVSDDPMAHLVDKTRAAMGELESRAAKHGVTIQFEIRMAEEIARYVIEAAIEHSCGLIVMSRGRVLHGSNAERVAERTHLPFLFAAGGAS